MGEEQLVCTEDVAVWEEKSAFRRIPAWTGWTFLAFGVKCSKVRPFLWFLGRLSPKTWPKPAL